MQRQRGLALRPLLALIIGRCTRAKLVRRYSDEKPTGTKRLQIKAGGRWTTDLVDFNLSPSSPRGLPVCFPGVAATKVDRA